MAEYRPLFLQSPVCKDLPSPEKNIFGVNLNFFLTALNIMQHGFGLQDLHRDPS